MNLPNNAKRLIDIINEAGYQAFVVGGFVRDCILDRDCGDVDLASSATPFELEKVLSDANISYVETGIKHGTITAILDGIPYEITTFRQDGDYFDSRHPNNVSFVRNIEDDLARRDFTINAIAYNDNVGIVDNSNGIEDINNKIIRTVGNPDKRFQEDALRIIRALRFASVLDFTIEETTKQSIHNNKELLKNVAVERVFVELKKLLLGDNVEQVLLEFRDVIEIIIPELASTFDFPQHTKWHIHDVYTHSVKSVALSPKKDYIRMTLLLHDIGKPFVLKTDDRGVDHFKGHPQKSVELSTSILKRLKCSNDFSKKVLTLIEHHDAYITTDSADIKRWLRTLGEDLTLDYIDVKISDLMSHNLVLSQHEIDTLREIKQQAIDVISSNEPYKISDLAINGNDLISLGFNGKEISKSLDYLVQIVSENPSLNNKDSLIEIIKREVK